MPDFAYDERKAAARELSILRPWRDLSGRRCIPSRSHYASLCGPLGDASGNLLPSSELLHLHVKGLFELPQFFGVEVEPSVHGRNVEAVESHLPPKLRPCLHEGDLSSVLSHEIGIGALKPAIVNIDLMVGPKKALPTLTKIVSAMNLSPGPAMLVWNVVVHTRKRGRPQDMRADLEKAKADRVFRHLLDEGGWAEHLYGEYDGTGPSSQTVMGTTVFWRSAR